MKIKNENKEGLQQSIFLCDMEYDGVLIDEYPVDESQSVSNAGSARVFLYKGVMYEVILWNEMTENNVSGQITINNIKKIK